MDNTSANRSIHINKFQKAMLVYRNSVDPETKTSPAMVIFGRPIRDSIPIPMGRYCPHPTWTETIANREKTLDKRHTREREKWQEHTHALPSLKIGDHIYLQNLVGNHPRRWERTGTVVEVRQFHQYVVKIDGSSRVTLRNRQHLRKFTPFTSKDDILESFIPPPKEQCYSPTADPAPVLPSNESPVDAASEDQPPPAEPSRITTRSPTRSLTPPAEPQPLPTIVHSSRESTAETRKDSLTPKKIPRALARLQPHNESGASEGLLPRRQSGRRNKD